MEAYLPLGKALGKYVGRHVVRWAIYKSKRAACYDLSNKMVAYVDMFCTRVVVVVGCQS